MATLKLNSYELFTQSENSDSQLDENGQLTNVTWPEVPNA